MKFKERVDPRFLSAPAWLGLWLADGVHKAITGEEATCTSTGEAVHSAARSRHYAGEYGFGFSHAFDLRIWKLTSDSMRAQFLDELRAALSDDYFVLLEADHIHVHWAPLYNGD